MLTAKRPVTSNRSDSKRLRARTRDVLDREIAFIPNGSFRELDAERAWEIIPSSYSADDRSDGVGASRVRMPAHLERMCAAPLLTPAEERRLFCHMNYLKYRANALRSTLDANRPSKKKLTEIDRLLAAANFLRNQIVHANVRLVVSIVKKFADERNPFDDLLSEGISCLIKSVEKFDYDRGFRFSTYATRAVSREVYRLIQRHHRDRSRYATGKGEVLDQELNSEDHPERSEASWLKIDRSIGKLLTTLDDRERFIVHARYGFEDIGEKPTFQKLGKLLGVSKERVRQIEQRALNKLRELAAKHRIEPAF